MNKPQNIQLSIGLVEDIIRLIGNMPISTNAGNVWEPLVKEYQTYVKNYQETETQTNQEKNVNQEATSEK